VVSNYLDKIKGAIILKFKFYINESNAMLAFWITPDGKVIDCGVKKHIDFVVENPEKFNITKEEIKKLYEKYNEKIGTEGKARQDIILNVIKNGFIRVRKYKNSITINANNFNSRTKKILQSFAKKLISGELGIKEKDRYIDVNISTEVGRGSSEYNLDDISKGAHLFEEDLKDDKQYNVLVDNSFC